MEKLFLALFIVVITSCEKENSEINIIGKIAENNFDEIEYTVPINGVSYFGFKESIQPDSLGNFQINLVVERPSIIEFFGDHKSFGSLIVEPKMNYKIFINTKLEEDIFRVESKNKEGQKLYNQLPNRSIISGGFPEGEARKIKDTIVSEIRQNISNTEKLEMIGFKDLLEKKIISEEFFFLVKTDREYFYKSVEGNLHYNKFFMSQYNGNLWPKTKDEYNKNWKLVFQNNSVANPELLSSIWFYDYITNYLNHIEFTTQTYDSEHLKELNAKGQLNTYHINKTKKYLEGATLEYYYAAHLLFVGGNKNFEKELILLFNQFKKEYPTSKYNSFLEPIISEIVAFHKEEESVNKKIKFISDFEIKNSLKEVVSELKGKKIYVDVWATWCPPCKVEFGYKEKLEELLKSEGIETVYVSIDREDREKLWRKMINFYNLDGYHVRVNEELRADLRKIYNSNGRLSIPWYLLIDEEGNVTKHHAAKPSQINELKKDINEVF